MTPDIQDIDHIHVYVSDQIAAEAWYGRVLGLRRVPELEGWSLGGGPLTLADAGRRLKLALFESADAPPRAVVALRVDADGFLQWRANLRTELGCLPKAVDHDLSWSLYFRDPDGNDYEITCYEHAALQMRLPSC
ncbi:VOC family protein [Chromobacterium paludis]|nr:VOC family protein [Chromobacterium paludis]